MSQISFWLNKEKKKSLNSTNIFGCGLQTDLISHWCSLLWISVLNPPLRLHLAFVQKHMVAGKVCASGLCVCVYKTTELLCYNKYSWNVSALGYVVHVRPDIFSSDCWCESVEGVTQNPSLRWSLWFLVKGSGRDSDLRSVHCVNTAHETWPQLIQLMTQRGRGPRRTLQKNMADVLKLGGMRGNSDY